MTRISFGPLAYTTLGFERIFDDIDRVLNMSPAEKSVTTFPPHNIIKLDDNRYMVELAVAGFSKDEIDIEIVNGTLSIKGQKLEKVDESLFIHRGIATRSFTKELRVADTIEVKGAEFRDGILRIALENIVPEHKKPRKIEIGNNLSDFKPQVQLLNESKAA